MCQVKGPVENVPWLIPNAKTSVVTASKNAKAIPAHQQVRWRQKLEELCISSRNHFDPSFSPIQKLDTKWTKTWQKLPPWLKNSKEQVMHQNCLAILFTKVLSGAPIKKSRSSKGSSGPVAAALENGANLLPKFIVLKGLVRLYQNFSILLIASSNQ